MTQQIFALVYQAGIANIFRIAKLSPYAESRKAERIKQGCFDECFNVAVGLGIGGHKVRTFSCNVAGDCAGGSWAPGLDDCPFRESARIITAN